MEVKYDKPRLWKKSIGVILDVLAALLLLFSVLISMLVHWGLNSENCKNAICNEEFDKAVEQAIMKSLEASNTVIELDTEKLVKDIKMDALVVYAREYTAEFIDSVFSSNTFEAKPLDNEIFKNAVLNQLQQYSDEFTEEEMQEICDEVVKKIQSTLQYIPAIITNRVQKASTILVKLQVLKKLEIPMYFFTSIIVVFNFIFRGEKHRLDVFFGVSASMWIAFVTILIPLIMLCIYDIPSKVALGESLLLYFIKGLNRVFIVNSSMVLGIILSLITVALVMSVVLISKRKVKQREKEEQYKRKIEKTVDKTV